MLRDFSLLISPATCALYFCVPVRQAALELAAFDNTMKPFLMKNMAVKDCEQSLSFPSLQEVTRFL